MTHLTETLAFYRRKLEQARKANDTRAARIFSIIVTQMFADTEEVKETEASERQAS